MKLFVVMGQRKEEYDGQYAPEALVVIDEFGNDENPEWLLERLAHYKSDKSFEVVRVITVTVNTSEIVRALTPKPAIVEGIVETD